MISAGTRRVYKRWRTSSLYRKNYHIKLSLKPFNLRRYPPTITYLILSTNKTITKFLLVFIPKIKRKSTKSKNSWILSNKHFNSTSIPTPIYSIKLINYSPKPFNYLTLNQSNKLSITPIISTLFQANPSLLKVPQNKSFFEKLKYLSLMQYFVIRYSKTNPSGRSIAIGLLILYKSKSHFQEASRKKIKLKKLALVYCPLTLSS